MALYENFHPRYMLARQVTLNLLYLLLVSAAQASFVNVSIDDTYGDAMTGQKPVDQPSGPWDGANCTHCDIVPSVALAFDGTWTAATYNPGPNSNINITLSFTGQKKKLIFTSMIHQTALPYRGLHLGIFYPRQSKHIRIRSCNKLQLYARWQLHERV